MNKRVREFRIASIHNGFVLQERIGGHFQSVALPSGRVYTFEHREDAEFVKKMLKEHSNARV